MLKFQLDLKPANIVKISHLQMQTNVYYNIYQNTFDIIKNLNENIKRHSIHNSQVARQKSCTQDQGYNELLQRYWDQNIDKIEVQKNIKLNLKQSHIQTSERRLFFKTLLVKLLYVCNRIKSTTTYSQSKQFQTQTTLLQKDKEREAANKKLFFILSTNNRYDIRTQSTYITLHMYLNYNYQLLVNQQSIIYAQLYVHSNYDQQLLTHQHPIIVRIYIHFQSTITIYLPTNHLLMYVYNTIYTISKTDHLPVYKKFFS
eukprot:TRINITY_DN557_c0_g3_i1.p1 TRINITY_DN557_c0_g3~~TRINITY_DN557_c0_g3_i1.p1  ORF type:complete len:258 (-),score=-19.13 TRINITY_DN557_c0_g3_i1:53-826(-)